MKDDEDIKTMFSRFQVLVSVLQVLSKSYTTSNNVNKILSSLSARYIPKVTSIQEAKHLNMPSLESLIRNLQSHEMELNEDKHVIKSKTLALKSVAERSGGKTVRSSKVWKSEEASNEEVSDGNSDDEEMTFIIRRFQKLTKRSKRFSSRSSGFRGSSSKDKVNDQNNCFNCKKPGHFKADCPDMQKDRPKKGSLQKDNFISKFKKSLMTT